jgi:hypothetical protein
MDDLSTGGNTASVDSGSTGAAAAPTTFAEAFAADASPASDTPESLQTPSAAEQPTTPPEGSPQQTDDRSPFIPRARFDEVNTKKGELESKLQSLAWAEQVSPQEFQQIHRIANAFSRGDFIEGLNGLIAEGRKDPAVEAQIRSFAARTLAQRAQAQPEAQEPQPDLPIELADGRVVHLYSAEQQAKREAFLQQQWMRSVQQELQPLKQTHEQLQAEKAAAQAQAANAQFASSVLADVKARPGVTDDALRAMATAIAHDRQLPAQPSFDQLALATERAYRAVVLPTLSQQAEARTLDSLQRKAAASTSVNPGSAAPSAPKSVRSFHDLPADAWR